MSRMMNDRQMDIGKGKAGSVFPEETKTKSLKKVEGAGRMTDYPDTEEKVARDQSGAVSKAKGHPLKTGYRN